MLSVILFAHTPISLALESPDSQEPHVPPVTETGALLTEQRWQTRKENAAGFWAAMMNYRSTRADFAKEEQERRNKRNDQRNDCAKEIRTANRDAKLPVTKRCFRATLTIDLEILRKEKQYITNLPGISTENRNAALLRIEKLSEAISTIIQAIDANVYQNKEVLEESSKNLNTLYGAPKRHAILQIEIDRVETWINHILVRLHNIHEAQELSQPAADKIDESIACFEERETRILALQPIQDNNDLILQFRQVQSDLKFCIESARKIFTLNKEVEQDGEQPLQ